MTGHASVAAGGETLRRLGLARDSLCWTPGGHELEAADRCLAAVAHALCGGQIVALKGLGGFQLLVDARSEAAMRCLRERKCRLGKPFAVIACRPLIEEQG